MKVCIIGLGEIGWETFKEISKSKHEMIGVEVSEDRIKEINPQNRLNIVKEVPSDADVYIIAVYLPKHIRSVISKIDLSRDPLVVIESTLQPGESKKMLEENPKLNLVLFPHRYNPNDPKHHVFNLNRLIGAYDNQVLMRAINFYGDFISKDKLFIVNPKIAELAKPIENAYRYIEIAIAEELKLLCDDKNISFDELRAAVNTKWNIDIKEARNGIGGKCLPKDCKFINEFFEGNTLFQSALYADEDYRAFYLKRKGIVPEDYREV